jgi:hypothetical protein
LCVLRILFKHLAPKHVIPNLSYFSLASRDPIRIVCKLDNPRTGNRECIVFPFPISKQRRLDSSVSTVTLLWKTLYCNPDRMHASGYFLFSSLAIGYPAPCLMPSRAISIHFIYTLNLRMHWASSLSASTVW